MMKGRKIKYLPITLLILFYALSFNALKGQTAQEDSPAQYLLRSFTDSKVLMTSGRVENMKMNYNTLTETMVYLKNGDFYDITNSRLIDTVYLGTRKFIPEGKAFYEYLERADMPLFCQVKSILKPVGKDAGYGSVSHTSATTSYSHISSAGGNFNLKLPPDNTLNTTSIYWINKTSDFSTRQQFLKLFPEKSDELKKYIKKNRIKFDNTDDIIKVVNYCSGL